MAAPGLLLLLLLALTSNIQAEVLKRPRWSHVFRLDATADYCSVSRWTAEGRQLLWNSSGSDYEIQSLAVSHSGQYQVQCWAQGNLRLHSNSTLLVCDSQEMQHQTLHPSVGDTLELTCDGVGPNQSVAWACDCYTKDGLALIENQQERAEKKPSLLLTVDRAAPEVYYCLEKQPHGCVIHGMFSMSVSPVVILRSVGESLELNCSDGTRNRTHKWSMDNSLWSHPESLNSTLMFPSLSLKHTGRYTCHLADAGSEIYYLAVCPEPRPPAVQLFTGGENLTLLCGDWTERVDWFMRTNRTGGRLLVVDKRPDNVYLSGSGLEIRNVSLQDSGHFWCHAMKGRLCVFSSETLVMFGEPELDHLLLRSVLLSAVLLPMLCVVVGVTLRRPPQAPVEEQEMMSPESDLQEDAAGL